MIYTFQILLGMASVMLMIATVVAANFAARGDDNAEGSQQVIDGYFLPAAEDGETLVSSWKAWNEKETDLAGEKDRITLGWEAFNESLKLGLHSESDVWRKTDAEQAVKNAQSRLKDLKEKEVNRVKKLLTAKIAQLSELLAELRPNGANSLSDPFGHLFVTETDRLGKNAGDIGLVWVIDPKKPSGGFWASKRELTLEQYEAVAGEGKEPVGYKAKPGKIVVAESTIDNILRSERDRELGADDVNRQ